MYISFPSIYIYMCVLFELGLKCLVLQKRILIPWNNTPNTKFRMLLI